MPAFTEWMAPTNSTNALETASNRPMLFDGLDKVGTTSWCVAAVAPQ